MVGATWGARVCLIGMDATKLTNAQIRTELNTVALKLISFPAWASALARKAALVAELQRRGQTSY